MEAQNILVGTSRNRNIAYYGVWLVLSFGFLFVALVPIPPELKSQAYALRAILAFLLTGFNLVKADIGIHCLGSILWSLAFLFSLCDFFLIR